MLPDFGELSLGEVAGQPRLLLYVETAFYLHAPMRVEHDYITRKRVESQDLWGGSWGGEA